MHVLSVRRWMRVAFTVLFILVLPGPATAAPPANDNFGDATIITSLPFSETVDLSEATTEPDEPPFCRGGETVWYAFTPTSDVMLRATPAGSNVFDAGLSIYESAGDGFGGLSWLGCSSFGNEMVFEAHAGTTYYIQGSRIFGGGGTLGVNLDEVPPPPNDAFANATAIDSSSLPFSDSQTARAATLEPNEPVASCNVFGAPDNSWWYSFSPTTTGSYTVSTFSGGLPTVAVYTGGSLGSLSEEACRSLGGSSSFSFAAMQGVTYYVQVGDYYAGAFGGVSLSLDSAPDPVAEFFFSPGDPSPYDTVQFFDNSFDPGGSGFSSEIWDFGDGTTQTNPGPFPTHQFPADGEYTVELAVTTLDGRTASVSKTIQVRTHDVAILKFTAPQAAGVGQTRQISVGIGSTRYPETVQVQLFKSVPGGFQEIGSLTQDVPVRGGNRTTAFSFSYTFTSGDATIGKVTFKAVATLIGARDALPTDNEAISSPTKVS